MFKKILLSAILLFDLNNFALAKEKISLDELLKLGLENNLKIKSFKNKKDIYLSQIIIANSVNNPVFNTDISPPQRTYRFGVNQEIEIYSKRQLRIDEAKKNKELYELELNKLINEIKFQIKSKFNDIAYLEIKANKYNKLIETFKNLINISNKREKVGDIPKIDINQLELIYLNLLNEREDILSRLNQEKINISEFIGISIYDKDFNYENYLKFKSIPKIYLADIYQKNVEIFYFNKLKEYFFTQKLKVESENIPNFTLGSGLDIVTENQQANFGTFINLNVPIPIFYKKEGEIKELEAKIFQLDFEIDNLKQVIKIKIDSFLEKINFLKKQINLYENEILPKSMELVKKSNKAFEAGKYGIVNSILFYQNYIQNELKYIDIIYEYKKKHYQFRKRGL
ncbi:MAG: hypothetical protein KatS3mg068_0567 [Candidatus Sericytochromatia bacterium]|nr:MAG: hypothetical protein KatS3mg068_0567 [Candidatus Sericytochromatia bacterium]